MFLMSNSTKICNVFNKYKSKIVQLNFKIKVVSLPGNKDKFPPESLIICREILNPIPLPPLFGRKEGDKYVFGNVIGNGRSVVGNFYQYGFRFIAVGTYVDMSFFICIFIRFDGLYGIFQ